MTTKSYIDERVQLLIEDCFYGEEDKHRDARLRLELEEAYSKGREDEKNSEEANRE